MKITTAFLMTIALLFSACSAEKMLDRTASAPVPMSTPASESASVSAPALRQGAQAGENAVQAVPAKLDTADKAQSPVVPTDRKIIRNGELTIELDNPDSAQRRITTIAESLGGFVVTSESQQTESHGQQSRLSVTVIVRVPSEKFAAAIDQIRGLGAGAHILHEKISGQDVTEEYIDLEARIRTKKALEAQFMEIMKRAQKISDALEVQSQLAEVRGEIERLEGRRRFLENQSSLSTITIHLQTPAPLVATTTPGFWHNIREAFGDGLTTATEIILGFIRLAFVLVPVLLLIVLPAWLVWRLALRRMVREWFKRPSAVSTPAQG